MLIFLADTKCIEAEDVAGLDLTSKNRMVIDMADGRELDIHIPDEVDSKKFLADFMAYVNANKGRSPAPNDHIEHCLPQK